MLSSLRIIHPPCSDNPTNIPVLILNVDSKRFLFNAPEGTTRSLIQRSAKGTSRGLGHIFLPKVGVQECGGLPGLLMSLADAQRPEVTIHGPPVIAHWLATCRYHLRRDSIKVSVVESPDLSEAASTSTSPDYIIYKDESITIEAIPIIPAGFELPQLPISQSNGRASKRPRSVQHQHRRRERSTSPSTVLQVMFPNDNKPAAADSNGDGKLSNGQTTTSKSFPNRPVLSKNSMEPPILSPTPTQPGSELLHQAPVLMHIVQGSSVRGRLDAKKANSLGVPTGRLMGQLSNGQDVTIERPKDWFHWDEKKQAGWLSKNPLAVKKNVKRPRSRSRDSTSGVVESVKAVEETEKEEMENILIKSSDVMGEARAGATFVQLYLPSTEYLDSFLSELVQSRLKTMQEEPHAIIHCVHPDILQSSQYQNFIRNHTKTSHIIVSQPCLPDQLAFPSSALSSIRMNRLDANLFPLPHFEMTPKMQLKDIGIEGGNVHLARMDTKIDLHPRGAPGRYDDLALDIDSPLDSEKTKKLEAFEIIPGRKKIEPSTKHLKQKGWREYIKLANAVKDGIVMSNGATADGNENDTFKITTLGTGSALPSKYRNVSATLLHMPGKDAGYILLDAGESTYSQLKRKFQDKIDEVIANIRLIFLSHAHADHHMGTSRILLERAKLNVERPLFVIAPYFLRRYLEEVQQIESLGISDNVESNGVIFLDSESLDSCHGIKVDVEAYPELRESNVEDAYRSKLQEEARQILSRYQPEQANDSEATASIANKFYKERNGRRQETQSLRDHLTTALHGTQVFTTEVDHRTSNCYGIIMRGKGWSAAYSGDTRPCSNLVAAGKGVEILIHEATIEDSEPEMADMKGHSTFGQAINVAKEMGAKYVMLTHFSQRYPKLPKLKSNANLGDLKVGTAFDLLTVKLSDFDKMMRYREALEMLFEVDGEEEDATQEENSKSSGAIKASDSSDKRLGGAESANEAAEKMEIDSVEQSDLAKQIGQNAKTLDSNIHENGSRRFKRKFIKSYEFQYVCFYLKPVQKMTIKEAGIPSRLSIAQTIQDELVDLHGVVNGSFNWDLLHVQSMEDKNAVRVVLKVPSSYLQIMQATVSSGLNIRTDKATYQAQFDRTCSSLDLISLDIGDSQAWFDSISKSIN